MAKKGQKIAKKGKGQQQAPGSGKPGDKKGEEYYQVSIGGNSTDDASLGKILGPSFFREDVPGVVEKVLEVYVAERHEDERFLDTYRRIGLKPFKERVYASDN